MPTGTPAIAATTKDPLCARLRYQLPAGSTVIVDLDPESDSKEVKLPIVEPKAGKTPVVAKDETATGETEDDGEAVLSASP